ncbi:MAG: aldehyde ferredoxin oxidoreductase N-terminal domain-containing protein [Candidatus Thermoplasmatota archaeon]
MYLRNGRACVVDLAAGDASEQELAEEALAGPSSLAVAESLRREHGDAVVLGTGVLTGSLVPAACAGFVSSSKGVMPLLGLAGVELKLTGFDFVVVKGECPVPSYLWVRDGLAEVVPYEGMAPMDSWARTERIRADQGDRRIQVIAAGLWGDSQGPASSLAVSHWLGEDDVHTAAEFGRRRLAAVAFRGMGELEVSDPDGHLSASVELRAEHSSRLGPSSGLASYWEGARASGFSSLLHRNVACFGCPHPCRSYLKVNEEPGHMALSAKEPGYMHFDVPSLERAAAAGMGFGDATHAFMECAKAGADPASVIGPSARDLGSVRRLLASGGDEPFDRSSAKGSFRSLPAFDECVGLGLCPRYWTKAGLDMDAVSACAEPALGRGLR